MAENLGVVRDVVIVGGGAAGLSAALTLARARRSVTVIDAGEPRNAPAGGVHGLLALDGVGPDELIARGRKEVLGYGGEILDGEVVDISRTKDVFAITLRDNRLLHARRLLIATGLVDVLPDVPGVREQWGRGVVHCPYCHGWEVRDHKIGVLAMEPMELHKAFLFRQWSSDIVLFAGGIELDAEQRAQLDAFDIAVVGGAVDRLEIDGDRLTGVRLRDGRVVEVDTVAVSTKMVARTDLFTGIGIESTPHPSGGAFIKTDEVGQTAVPGVWAAGNASDISAQVSGAAAEGARAAQHINANLVMDELTRAVAANADTTAITERELSR
ncbi:NAD(P)/FAD-dependent oxidoreductase [Rhodococcus sp. G-MC3]|uniref:NAD(P)/FAD-dependent oxidoreductase n=1 Tax=Rhodococcus sp. G-MC3 TaxID=3046209 RepID=UPI0024BACE2E|nr:NAD(P)/FAD-dependent oxidoreductase [Rhodococcus sp. G-MC3]MDJ0396715.1 NAD(P)/FAD-dependent oxidoreductase [Rhodococcus sp. G-MC3]